MGNLKVYGGLIHSRQRVQARTIIAATSVTRAREILAAHGRYVSANAFREYWSITGNEAEISAALAQPGVILQEKTPNKRDFEALT